MQVVRKSVITRELSFALDRKIAGKLKNVEVVKINTLTKKHNIFQIIYWLLLPFVLCPVLPRAQSNAKMSKAVTFQTNLGRSRTPATYNMNLIMTLAKRFQLSAVT